LKRPRDQGTGQEAVVPGKGLLLLNLLASLKCCADFIVMRSVELLNYNFRIIYLVDKSCASML